MEKQELIEILESETSETESMINALEDGSFLLCIGITDADQALIEELHDELTQQLREEEAEARDYEMSKLEAYEQAKRG